MNMKWTRLLSMLLCLALLLAAVPSWAESDAVSESEISSVETPEKAPDPTQAPPEPTAAPTPEPTPEPTAAPTPEPVQATEEPVPTEEPAAVPEITAVPEENVAPEATKEATLDALVASWIDALRAQKFSNDYRKALWLYDRMIASLAPGDASDALSALSKRSASALGYALAYEAVLKAAGIDCATVSYKDAAWNVAKLDGSWTHIDVYMDDAPNCFGLHFGLTDAAMAADHSWDANQVPACAKADNNYFVKEKNYAAFAGRDALSALLASAAERGAATLSLFNAGEQLPIGAAVRELLQEIDPEIRAEISERGCYATVQLFYANREAAGTAEPTIDTDIIVTEEPVVGAESSDDDAMETTPDAVMPAQPAVMAIAPEPRPVILTAAVLTLGVGETSLLNVAELVPMKAEDAVVFSSAAPGIASVNALGKVTAKAVGSTDITLSLSSGSDYGVHIEVKPAPHALAIEADRTVLGIGETMQIGHRITAGSASVVTFSAPEGQSVIDLTPDGLVTARTIGSVVVTARTFNDKIRTVTLEVKKAPTSLTFATKSVTLGQKAVWTPEYKLSENSAGKVSFSSSNASVAQVDPDTGAITALGVGTATVTATVDCNGVSGKLAVTVVPGPESIELSIPSTDIGIGERLQLVPRIEGFDADQCGITYKSSDSSVIVVGTATGAVRGKKAGTVTITATAYNGATGSIQLTAKPAPRALAIEADHTVLGIGETMQIGHRITADSASVVTFSAPEGQNVIDLTPDGHVTARTIGSVVVTARTFNDKIRTVTLEVKKAPTSLTIEKTSLIFGIGQTAPLGATLDEGSGGKLDYHIEGDPDVASIDADGTIKALKTGKVRFTVTTYVEGLEAAADLEVRPAPTSISFDQTEYAVDINEPFQLTPTLSEGSAAGLTYKPGSQDYFSIDDDGLITPIKRGNTTVKVTTHNGLSAKTTVWVVDPTYPEILRFAETPPTYMDEGDVYQPSIYVFPETADPELTWTSSNPSVARVDPVTGEVHVIAYGKTGIKAVSARNPKLTLNYQIIVNSKEICLVMPTHRTDTTKIASTLAQIERVRDSAYYELQVLANRGWITDSERIARKRTVRRAFDMYLFPWMTNSTVYYWKAANSEGGQKDFKPGTVYYGVAYTQSNRVNTPETMIANGYYKDSGKGYYTLQTNKFASRMYPGSDCSSFVSMAVWGYNDGRRGDTTRTIASSSSYRTLSEEYWNDLRPGDLLCKSGSHVVMFLYYATPDKSQVVVIEQGGGGDDLYSNCVSTSIRNISHYKNSGYSIRRVFDLDMDYMS